MSKLTIFVSATIVLILPWSRYSAAAPQPEIPPDSPVEERVQEAPLDENLSLTEPPPLGKPAPPANQRYYTYQQALTLRGGFGLDLSGDTDEVQRVLGAQYMLPSFLSPRVEIGADLHNDGNGHIHVGLRKVFSERGYFHPSLKAGLDHLVDSKENLATFTHINNYYLSTAGTIEFVVWNPYSLRLEEELLFGLKKTWSITTLGLSRAW
jgi:hypothetical protein